MQEMKEQVRLQVESEQLVNSILAATGIQQSATQVCTRQTLLCPISQRCWPPPPTLQQPLPLAMPMNIACSE